MLIFLQEFVLQIFLWILKLIDGIMEIFSAISGITDVTYQGQKVNIIEYLVGDSTITTIFWCIFILSVGLTCIFAISSLIKNMITNQKNISTIIGKFMLALLGTMCMLLVVFLIILISNAILVLVSQTFEISNTTKLSNSLFNAVAGEWLNGYSVAEFDVNTCGVREIFGEYSTGFVFPDYWKNNGMVKPDSFLYLPSLVAGIALVFALITAIINLAKRIYEIVFMYMVMPISMSTLPLDDGNRFKVWRETFVSKIVIAYGTVFSVNIFILILPIITKMKVANISGFGNSMFVIFMMIGGSYLIPAGQSLFCKLFGSSDDMNVGGSFMHSSLHASRMAAGMTFGAIKTIAKGGIFLGKHIGKGKEDKSGNNNSTENQDESDKFSESQTNNVNTMEDINDEEN